jgi:uncharacterized membrane protein
MASTQTALGDQHKENVLNETSRSSSNINVNETERWVSAVGGGAIALYGLMRGDLGGIALAFLGGSLLYRGTTGHCNLYSALGINTAEKKKDNVSVQAGTGIKLEKSITINRSPEELFQFWRNLENLPKFMNHLESVMSTGHKLSHWVAKAPAGTSVEWDAEIINEKENEMIAWRSLEGSDVDNAGSVHFEKTPNGQGTIVKVSIRYNPPGGKMGDLVAKLFGESPDQQIEEDLHRFKQLIEAGEISTTQGQSSGQSATA